MMPVHEQRQHEGEKEEYDIHNPKHPTRLEHRAVLVEITCQPSAVPIEPKRAQFVEDGWGGEVVAASMTDATKFVDSCDKCANKAEIDEGNENGWAASGAQTDKSGDSPSAGKGGGDEEDEDKVGGEFIVLLEAIDKPRLAEVSLETVAMDWDSSYQHAYDWNESDEFNESPPGEENPSKHFDSSGIVGSWL